MQNKNGTNPIMRAAKGEFLRLTIPATKRTTNGDVPCPSSAGGLRVAPHAEGEIHPAEGEIHPAEGEIHPAEGEIHPAEGEIHPAEGEIHPARAGRVVCESPDAERLPFSSAGLSRVDQSPRASAPADTNWMAAYLSKFEDPGLDAGSPGQELGPERRPRLSSEEQLSGMTTHGSLLEGIQKEASAGNASMILTNPIG
eukprot:1187626-Prorocentrum_minimum.AAC.8